MLILTRDIYLLFSRNSKHLAKFFLIFGISQKFIKSITKCLYIKKLWIIINFFLILDNRRTLFKLINFPILLKFMNLCRTSHRSILFNRNFFIKFWIIITIILNLSWLFFSTIIFIKFIIWFFTLFKRSCLSLRFSVI